MLSMAGSGLFGSQRVNIIFLICDTKFLMVGEILSSSCKEVQILRPKLLLEPKRVQSVLRSVCCCYNHLFHLNDKRLLIGSFGFYILPSVIATACRSQYFCLIRLGLLLTCLAEVVGTGAWDVSWVRMAPACLVDAVGRWTVTWLPW